MDKKMGGMGNRFIMLFVLAGLMLCPLIAFASQVDVTFDATTDLGNNFNPSSSTVCSNLSSGGINNTGYVDIPSGTETWTLNTGFTVTGASVYTLTAFFRNGGNSGYTGFGFTNASSNEPSTYGNPAVSIGATFHGGGGYFMNNGAATSISWNDATDLVIGNWYKMIYTLTDNGDNTFNETFEIWFANADGSLVSQKTTHSRTSTANTDIAWAAQIYPYFCNSGTRADGMDNFHADDGVVNNPPVIAQVSPLSVTMDEDGFPTAWATPTITATDPDGDTLNWGVFTDPTNGVVTVAGTGASPTISYTPNADYYGSDSFVVEVTDGSNTDTITVNVTINAVDELAAVFAKTITTANNFTRNGGSGTYYYETQSFTVTEDETYTIEITSSSFDPYLYLYNSPFDPLDTATNLVASDDDGGSGSLSKITYLLTAGDYVVVPTSFAVGITGDVTVEVGTPRSVTVPKTVTSANSFTRDGATGTYYYETQSLTVYDDSTYSIDVSSGDFDTYLYLYHSPFDPISPAVNLIAEDDDGHGSGNLSNITISLTAGDYEVVLTSYAETTTGNATLKMAENQAPVIAEGASVSATMSEDGSPTDWPTAAPSIPASDVDGDSLTWGVDTYPTNGVVTVSGTGTSPTTFTYTPDADFYGSDSFDIQVSDGNGGRDTITVAVTVTAVNDAPTITSSAPTTATEDTLYQYTMTVSDPDDANDVTNLSFSLSGAPGDMSVSSTGVITWTPAEGVTTSGAVTATVSDGGEDSAVPATETFTVTVTQVNDAPVLTAIEAKSVDEGAALTFTASATDADLPGDVLTYSLDAGAPTGAAIDSSTGAFSWTPTEAQGGASYSVTVRVTDDAASPLDDFETISVTVNELNDAPVLAAIGAKSVDEGAALTFTASATDADLPGDVLTYSLDAGAPAGATIDPATGAFSWTPTEAQGGASYSVTVRVTDDRTPALDDFETVVVTVAKVNTAPIIDTTAVMTFTAIDEDVALAANPGDLISDIIASAGGDPVTDPDTDAVEGVAIIGADSTNGSWQYDIGGGFNTFPAVSDTAALLLSDAALVRFVPDADYNGSVDPGLTFRAWDRTFGASGNTGVDTSVNGGTSAFSAETATAAITVNPVNDPPAFSSTPITGATQDTLYTYPATAEDIDAGDSLVLSAPTLPAWLTFTDNGDGTGQLTGSPSAFDVGAHPVELSVSDGAAAAVTQSFTISVSNTNDPPTLISAPSTAATQDILYSYAIEAQDIDAGDVLTISSGQPLPLWLSLADNGDGTATLSGTPANADVGDHPITIQATDAAGAADSQSFTISAANVNDPPAFSSTAVIGATQDVLYTYNIQTTDPDILFGDALVVTAPTIPSWLSFTDNGDGTALLTGTPAWADTGSAAATLRVEDASGEAVEQTFGIFVANVNDPPSIVSAAVVDAAQDAAYSYDIATTDPDGDVPAITAVEIPLWLFLTDNGDGSAALTGTPGNGDVGDHPVSIQAADAFGGVDSQSFTISVVNVNDPPAFTSAAPVVVAQDALYSYAATADDPDGDSLVLTSETLPAWLSINDNGGNSWTISGAPGNGDVGDHEVVIRAADPEGAADVQTFVVTVSNVNDPPAFTSAAVTAATQDAAYVYDIATTDPDGDVPAISGVQIPSWLSLTDNGDGAASLAGTPGSGDVGDHPVSIWATDPSGETDVQSFTISVANINDPPAFSSPPILGATQGVAYAYEIVTADPDAGDAPMLSAPTLPVWLTFTDNGDGTGLVSGTPGNADVGDHPTTIRVSDGNGETVDQSFTITVSNTNDPPRFTSAAVTGATQDAAYRYDVTAEDIDGAVPAITAPTLPSWLFLTDNGDGTASLSGTPGSADVGDHAATLRATDAAGAADAQNFTISVANVNDPPVIVSQTPLTVAEEASLTLALANFVIDDPDGDDPSGFSLTALPGDHYRLDGLTLTPEKDFNGVLQVGVTANDGAVDGPAFTTSIAVTPLDDPPTVATPLADVSALEDDLDKIIDLSGAFTDIDNDPAAIVKTVAGNSNPTLLSASIQGDGLTLDFQKFQSGSAVIEIQGESNGLTVSDAFTVTVAPVRRRVSGRVLYFSDGAGVPGMTLTLAETGQTAVTDANGNYVFTDVPSGNYGVVPSGGADPGPTGVSVTDASRIARHVIGELTLADMEWMAADVTRNGAVTGTDASRLARYALEFLASLNENNINWRFYPEQSPELLVDADVSGQDFTAVRLGDVSGNYAQALRRRSARSASPRIDAGVDVRIDAGEIATLPVRIDGAESVEGLDMAIDYDPAVLALESVSMTGGVLPASAYAILVNANQPGRLKIGVYAVDAVSAADGVVLTVRFKATGPDGSASPVELTRFDLNEQAVESRSAAFDGGFEVAGRVSQNLWILLGDRPFRIEHDRNGDDRVDVRDALIALRAGELADAIRILQICVGIK